VAVNVPLDEMSVEEKLQLLEAVWADLSRVPDELESPGWHEEALEETERRIQAGQATFSDWQKAKGSIRDRLYED
jgi:Putative addiction module component